MKTLATLTAASLLALVGALSASFFLSNVNDRRLWVLLALGVVLRAVAERLPERPGAALAR